MINTKTIHLKHHADVSAVDATDLEVVKKLNCAVSPRMFLVSLADTFEQLYFIQCCFSVMGRTLHHLEGNKHFSPEI